MLSKLSESAGALNERIIIQRATKTSDGGGGGQKQWSNLLTLWANVLPLSGRERDMANQTESPRNYRFTIRRNPQSLNISTKDRLVWRSKNMNIRFIADSGPKSLYITIDAEDGVAT